MLEINKVNIKEHESMYHLENGIDLYAKVMTSEKNNGKTALFIHGGGSGGNHTIVYRPSCWLLNRELFSKIILPDRRGAGYSSPMTSIMSYKDNALDMKYLLDSMGEVEKITVIGVSYGGPIALTLAALDKRIDEVILIASSPSLKEAKGLMGFLYRKGLLEKLSKTFYSRNIGKLEEKYPDFNKAYETSNTSQLNKLFLDVIKHMNKNRLDSLLFESSSTCDLKNAAIDKNLVINVPVYRVIGTKDETWEIDLREKYKSQIPNLRNKFIDNAKHKDLFFRASEFYEALEMLLLEFEDSAKNDDRSQEIDRSN